MSFRKFAWGSMPVVAAVTALLAQPLSAAETAVPFKLGTFRAGDRVFVGMVLQDTQVVDIAAANAAFERGKAASTRVRPPADMKELIARYDADVGPRLRELARFASGQPNARYISTVSSVRILPPVQPAIILNAGANYPEHLQGIAAQSARAAGAGASAGTAGSTGAGAANGGAGTAGAPPARGGTGPRAPSQSMPGYWDRLAGDTRQDNPYLFLKSPTAVVGANDDVVIPKGREQIDWECEFAVVVGKPAKNVPVDQAANHIFGYSIEFDVSDRGSRGDRKMGGGPDWLIQKNHDTFAPIGPYVVPKEFIAQPMNTRHYFLLNGEIKQDSNTSRMEYNIWEMLSYASNMMTLNPGDMISHGSPAGTNIERENPRWMRAGDIGTCIVEGIGEQKHHIVDQH